MRLSTLTGVLASPRSCALLAGMLVGSLAALLDASSVLGQAEQEYGLRWLFRARGPVEPPPEVVVIAMNRAASEGLWLPADPERYWRCEDLRTSPAPGTHRHLEPPRTARWPRCVHARLTDALASAGAKVIVFDVLLLCPGGRPDAPCHHPFQLGCRARRPVPDIQDVFGWMERRRAGGRGASRLHPRCLS